MRRLNLNAIPDDEHANGVGQTPHGPCSVHPWEPCRDLISQASQFQLVTDPPERFAEMAARHANIVLNRHRGKPAGLFLEETLRCTPGMVDGRRPHRPGGGDPCPIVHF